MQEVPACHLDSEAEGKFTSKGFEYLWDKSLQVNDIAAATLSSLFPTTGGTVKVSSVACIGSTFR